MLAELPKEGFGSSFIDADYTIPFYNLIQVLSLA